MDRSISLFVCQGSVDRRSSALNVLKQELHVVQLNELNRLLVESDLS